MRFSEKRQFREDPYRRPEGELTPQQRDETAVTDAHIEQLLAADVVVIGAPLYNLSTPSS